MIMILTLAIIIFIFSCLGSAFVDDLEYAEKQKERRHKELMEVQKKNLSNARKRRTTRRIVQKDDVVLGEEFIEEDL